VLKLAAISLSSQALGEGFIAQVLNACCGVHQTVHVVLLSPDYMVSCREKAWRQLGACCSLARAVGCELSLTWLCPQLIMECTLTKECVGYISTNYRGKQNAHKVNMTLPILANCPKSLAQALCNLSLLPIPLLSRLSKNVA